MNTIGLRVLRDKEGNRIGSEPAETVRVTKEVLGGNFGSDKRKRLIVTLAPGDIIKVRPERTQREESCTVEALYSWMLRCKADKLWGVRMQERKAKKKAARESRQIANADRRLRRQLKKEQS